MPHELLFPLTTMALTFFVLIPLATLICWGVLSWRRQNATIWTTVGSPTTFVLLIAPTLIPLTWLASATLHQFESYPLLQTCLHQHLSAQACQDVELLGCLLGLTVLLVTAARFGRHIAATHKRPYLDEHPAAQRIHALCQAHAPLRDLKVQVTTHCLTPIFTTGWLMPQVVMDACFVQAADDAMILATLLHERAHVRHRDALRRLLVTICFALNPLSTLLRHEYAHWRQALEARCDHDAVSRGGSPLALAQSIVQAAKFECGSSHPCALIGLVNQDMAALKLRVALLIEGSVALPPDRGYLAFSAILALGILSPHMLGPGLLELWHVEIERLFYLL